MKKNENVKPIVMKAEDLPMKDGKIDVAAILAASGIKVVDLS